MRASSTRRHASLREVTRRRSPGSVVEPVTVMMARPGLADVAVKDGVEPTMDKVLDEYKGKVRIVFMHQPLSFHAHAHLAAQASMAAHAEGKFWQYHDKLFENQKALERGDLESYAQQVGLNMTKFKQALDAGVYKSRVDRDAAAGTKVGASGTPTFFINGRRLVGAQPVTAFKQIIDEELKKKGKK